MEFAVVDGTPVPKILEYPCQQVSAEPGQALVSGYRGEKAAGLLKRLGKSTQAYLYWAFTQRLAGVPGFSWANPANRPRQSTHELFNDGVAYGRIVGRALKAWQCGMDWVNGLAAVQRFRELGYPAMLTYPDNIREKQHVNLTRKPRVSVWRLRPLKKGSRGRRVKYLKHQLHFIHDPDTHRPYFAGGRGKPAGGWGPWYDRDAILAVKAFQRDHGQVPDGVVGYVTKRNIDASYRLAQKRERAGER